MRKKIILTLLSCLYLMTSCERGDFGANPYDPDTPITVSQWPKVTSFAPEKGEAYDTITISGVNFTSASSVTFGGRDAESFKIIDDSTIQAILSPYGNSGLVAVTNHMGERSKPGFIYVWPEEPTENPNFALKGVATSSTPFSGFFATSANDGNLGSCWVAENNEVGTERWVMIELEGITEINRVITHWDPNAAATDYVLEVSEDGVTFTKIFEETGWLSNGADNGVKKINFNPVNAKYVRLNSMYNSVTPYNITLKEFEIYNTPPAVNVAKNKPVEADCEFTPGSIFHITDGSLANMWQCDKTHTEHWCIVDLGEDTPINNIVISWDGGAYAKNIKISLSNDKENFNEIYNITDWSPTAVPREENSVWTKVVTDISFEEAQTRYIRVDFNGDSSVWGISIYELEAYNQL